MRPNVNTISIFMDMAATHCNILQHTAPNGTTRQHTAPHCNTRSMRSNCEQDVTATHCNTLHHTATHCTTLQHPYKSQQLRAAGLRPNVNTMNTLMDVTAKVAGSKSHSQVRDDEPVPVTPMSGQSILRLMVNEVRPTATHCNMLQYAATYCNTLQHKFVMMSLCL